ncbi:hypothetical protein PBCVNEJV1_491R [Paramecium bursaria Chlorella virus NE-JV-1]|nr:hypothetical protein PBCVNEJV1_491R [Paramecium bursaria Chlorella virus NE-JV-1]
MQNEDHLVDYVSKHEDEIGCVDTNEDTLLHIYSSSKYDALQNLALMLRPSIVHEENKQGRTPIFSAIDSRNDRLVQKIIDVDPSTLFHMDENGTTALQYELSSHGDKKIVDIMFPFVTIDVSVLASLFVVVLGSSEKCISMLEHFPELYDFRNPRSYSILHMATGSVYQTSARAIVRYIHAHRPSLFSILAEDGSCPAHTCLTHEMLRLVVDLDPESLIRRDDIGQTPLHRIIGSLSRPSTIINIVRSNPEVLSAQDKHGKTISMMIATRSLPVFKKNNILKLFEMNPDSFFLKDTEGRTFLHHVTEHKQTNWFDMCEHIIQKHPSALFEKDFRGKNVFDYAIDTGGHGSFQLDREIFASVCLKYTAIPREYWIFKGIVPSLVHSFESIIKRSEEEAERAFEFLPTKIQKYIRETLLLRIDIPNDVKKKIIAASLI